MDKYTVHVQMYSFIHAFVFTQADRPGVLTLRILGVREECGMKATVCDRLPEGERCVALFNKATAAQLQPVPGDVVHIYPPWSVLFLTFRHKISEIAFV